MVDNCEGPELLHAIWHALRDVTVLDPACGSGAFLFAALNILEPLYEACLERMEEFVADLDRSANRASPRRNSTIFGQSLTAWRSIRAAATSS